MPGDFRGRPWGFNGKTMGRPWDFIKKCYKIHGYLRDFGVMMIWEDDSVFWGFGGLL
jgi:hypothetical protein